MKKYKVIVTATWDLRFEQENEQDAIETTKDIFISEHGIELTEDEIKVEEIK